ncbi:retrotransposon gag protein, partial [Trifolium medium]|nr:retrotransposon gag protein [Trifolium medium]
ARQMQQQSLVLSQLSKQIGQKTVTTEGDTSVGESSQYESRLAGKKVKLPLFDGDDPVAWITRAEIYFDVQNTSDVMRVKLARLSMEGATIHWFNLLMETEDDLSWEKLKKSLIARYGGRRLENPFEELFTLRQTDSVEDYVEAFELLSSQVGRLPEEQYLGDVEKELNEEDDDGDRSYRRKQGLDRLGRNDWAGPTGKNRSGFNLPNKDQNRVSHMGGPNPTQNTGSTGSNQNSNSSMLSTGRKGDLSQRSSSSERWKGVRSIQNEEIAERRAKGLCFKCGGKYHPILHKCPERSLRVLILGEGECVNDDGEIVSLEVREEEEEEELEAE